MTTTSKRVLGYRSCPNEAKQDSISNSSSCAGTRNNNRGSVRAATTRWCLPPRAIRARLNKSDTVGRSRAAAAAPIRSVRRNMRYSRPPDIALRQPRGHLPKGDHDAKKHEQQVPICQREEEPADDVTDQRGLQRLGEGRRRWAPVARASLDGASHDGKHPKSACQHRDEQQEARHAELRSNLDEAVMGFVPFHSFADRRVASDDGNRPFGCGKVPGAHAKQGIPQHVSDPSFPDL